MKPLFQELKAKEHQSLGEYLVWQETNEGNQEKGKENQSITKCR